MRKIRKYVVDELYTYMKNDEYVTEHRGEKLNEKVYYENNYYNDVVVYCDNCMFHKYIYGYIGRRSCVCGFRSRKALLFCKSKYLYTSSQARDYKLYVL